MKLKKSTWILVIVALLLGGGVVFYEAQIAPQREETQNKNKQIFSFTEAEIDGFTINKDGKVLKIKRNQGQTNPWQMKQPEDVPASDAVVSFLVDLLVEGKSDRSVNISRQELEEYGLEKPLATIEIQLTSDTSHKLMLGKADFSEKFVYALADPSERSEQELEIQLIPIGFKHAVERETKEWKQEQPEEEKSSATEEDGEQELEIEPDSPSN